MVTKAYCLVCAAAAVLLIAPGARAAGDFVEVQGTTFTTATCRDFVVSGYNTWQPIEAEAGLIGTSGQVKREFDEAVRTGMNVVRMFGFSVQQGINNQLVAGTATRPPVYNESMFLAFDRVIAEADRHNIKLIVALANNWDYNGNMSDCKPWYTNQTTTARSPDDFFTNPAAIAAYLSNAQAVMNRVNSVTKLAYNADPTIMAWNLMNEPRCEYANSGCDASTVQDWINRVAPVVKRYAPKQLVTVGQDGFWQADNCASDTMNPVANSDGWPLRTGQDFVPNHDIPAIDYTSIHMWPDPWARTDLDFGKAWLNAHLAQSRIIGKPLLLEEFGKAVVRAGQVAQFTTNSRESTEQQQQDYYKLAYAITEGSINAGDALRGIAFWRWNYTSTEVEPTDPQEQASVTTRGPVFTQTIGPFSQRVSGRCPTNSGAGGTTATSTAGRRLLQASTTQTAAPASPGSSNSGSNRLITGAAACQVNLTVPGDPA